MVIEDIVRTLYLLDIVRGSLCSAMKQILDQGLKRTSILGGPVHPWQFIQVPLYTQAVQIKYNYIARLKGDCHEKSMAVYNMRYFLRHKH